MQESFPSSATISSQPVLVSIDPISGVKLGHSPLMDTVASFIQQTSQRPEIITADTKQLSQAISDRMTNKDAVSISGSAVQRGQELSPLSTGTTPSGGRSK